MNGFKFNDLMALPEKAQESLIFLPSYESNNQVFRRKIFTNRKSEKRNSVSSQTKPESVSSNKKQKSMSPWMKKSRIPHWKNVHWLSERLRPLA